ncbi:hypothetical protein FA15DRAFT_672893 [Coprinopsis marcescibilis]|uniref:Nephrocystin 3-like N-terminal domain-containing protein n=1 Tax=Coprinopsis marcescibilis TaxID=230819 RepID=A0A5C3KLE5_COPMA|nr:hypothetical protein FA15DRAFT_672893 [Coprinopsis marcescibilis]
MEAVVKFFRWLLGKGEQPLPRPTPETVQVLSGANNASFQNVEINAAGRDINNVTNIQQALIRDDTERQNALAQILSPAGYSWDPLRACLAGTRTVHIHELTLWASKPRAGVKNAEILVIIASAGSGKSALAHTICQTSHEQDRLVTGFFFNQLAAHSSPASLMAAIIRGFCNISKPIRDKIADLIIKDNTLPSASILRQFNELILPACQLLPAGKTFVITIDAVDEGNHEDGAIIRFMTDCVPRLPPSFRVILTTRPDPKVTDPLHSMRHVHIFSHPLTGDEKSRNDLQTYIRSRLSITRFGPTIPEDLIQSFFRKADGLFLWAVLVLNHLETAYDPIGELRDILQGSSTNWTDNEGGSKKLHALFHRTLSKLKCSWTDRKFVEMYARVMGAIAVLKEPLSARGLAALCKQDGVTEKDVHRICEIVQPLLHGYSPGADHDEPIRLLHLSVQEYLTEHASAPYRLDCPEHHRRLSHRALATIDSEFVKDKVDGVGYSDGDWIWEAGSIIPNMPVISRDSVSEHLWYSCVYACEHTLAMSNTMIEQSHLRLLQNIIVDEPRRILEATASMGSVVDIVSFRRRALVLGAKYPSPSEIRDVVRTYCSAGRCLLRARRTAEALSLMKESVALARQLASKTTEFSIELELAMALNLLGRCLAHQPAFHDALQTILESLVILRRLASEDPHKVEPWLARSLTSQSHILCYLGRREEALEVGMEPVKLNRQLVAAHPSKFETSLAYSLEVQASNLDGCKKNDEAIWVMEEAVDILRQLSQTNASEHMYELAESLHIYASYLVKADRKPAALEADKEAISLFRQVAETAEEGRDGKVMLGTSLHQLAYHLSLCDRKVESIVFIKEAIQHRRQLVESRDTKEIEERKHESGLAHSLHNYARYLSTTGKEELGIAPGKESVEIRRKLAENDPEKFKTPLAWSLNLLCENFLARTDHKLSEETPFFRQAVTVCRQLADQDPNAHDDLLNTSLCNYGMYLAQWCSNNSDAAKIFKEMVEVRRRIFSRDPTATDLEVAKGLHNTVVCLVRDENHAQGVKLSQEAAEICRRHLKDDPKAAEPALGKILGCLAAGLSGMPGRRSESLRIGREAVTILRKLTKEDPKSEELKEDLRVAETVVRDQLFG